MQYGLACSLAFDEFFDCLPVAVFGDIFLGDAEAHFVIRADTAVHGMDSLDGGVGVVVYQDDGHFFLDGTGDHTDIGV